MKKSILYCLFFFLLLVVVRSQDDPTSSSSSVEPTDSPSDPTEPTAEPTKAPEPTDSSSSVEPTDSPSDPTSEPTSEPTPTNEPTNEPTSEPTEQPTEKPTPGPEPTFEPTPEPTAEPTTAPTPEPTAEPTAAPTPEPTTAPTPAPTNAPSERPCTMEDYAGTYTACESDNTRSVIYYLKEGVVCSGGQPTPSPKFHLPCGITCGPGSYLPIGETQCKVCPAGSYSIGGGEDISTWYQWPSDFDFETYGIPPTGWPRNAAYGWSLNGLYIKSGNISHSSMSVVTLPVRINSDAGQVKFTYRVSAEKGYDGLYFQVDGVNRLNRTSITLSYVTFTTPLAPGSHTLRWVYSKDPTVSNGEDAAYISNIQITGISYAADYCEQCPEGTYGDETNATSCEPCPSNTYSNTTGNTYCDSCSPSEYSFPESDHCDARAACTEADYELLYTACDHGQRILYPHYVFPIICDPSNPESVELDANVTEACGPCPAGMYRDEQYDCQYCPTGQASNGTHCAACPAGTAAYKVLEISQWDDWIPETGTGCIGDCAGEGWRLNSTNIDSGYGHGETVDSYFEMNVSLAEPGKVSFKFVLYCESDCRFTLTTGTGEDPAPFVKGFRPVNVTFNQALPVGDHTLRWSFTKNAFKPSRSDRVIVWNITVTGVDEGGAVECTQCETGSVSYSSSSGCSLCPAGQSSNEDNTKCELCPEGTHNRQKGGQCIPCGEGTYSVPDRTSCNVTCTFDVSASISYDLRALKTDTMYGPIQDSARQSYYLHVCVLNQQNNTCYDDEHIAIPSYACQITTRSFQGFQLGMNLGNVLAFHELPEEAKTRYNSTLGVLMQLSGGDYGCAPSHHGVAIPRETNVTYICDPTAGPGEPKPYHDRAVESEPCHYNFVWKSLYACPLCGDADIGYYYSSCQKGKRTKYYYWKESPQQCHDGMALPSPSVGNCSESTQYCPPGSFLQEDKECAPCPPGTYSVGGGTQIYQWAPIPAPFSSQCVNSPCSNWVGGLDVFDGISSGDGASSLTADYRFVVNGSISFQYMLYGHGEGEFTFGEGTTTTYLKVQTRLARNFEWVNVSFPISSGNHLFSWTFTNGLRTTNVFEGVVIKQMRIVGTDYHDDTCTPCPAGYASLGGNSSHCVACPANTYSGIDDAQCIACPEGEYSAPVAGHCTVKPTCTLDDFRPVYTQCTTIGFQTTRNMTYVAHQPQLCVDTDGVGNMTAIAPCFECPPYSARGSDGVCRGCAQKGYYLDQPSGKCVIASNGTSATRVLYYIPSTSNGSVSSEFKTGCNGPCGTKGWRIIDEGLLDSGEHYDSGVDSWLSISVDVSSTFGSMGFEYQLTTMEGILQMSIDGETSVLNNGLRSSQGAVQSVTSLAQGRHNIMFNYHQPAGTSGRAMIDSLSFRGVNFSSSVVSSDFVMSSYNQYCDPGAYTDKEGQEECTLCNPGTYVSGIGNSACLPCAEMTYTAEYGATECNMCRGGTYTQTEGSTYCSTSCNFTDGIYGFIDVTYNLNVLKEVVEVDLGDSMMYLDICNITERQQCQPEDVWATHACVVEPSRSFSSFNNGTIDRNWGATIEFVGARTSNSSNTNVTFDLNFVDGDNYDCPYDQSRIVTVAFTCNMTAGIGKPKLEKREPCRISLSWSSSLGCQVCNEASYSRVLGECVDGKRSVRKIRETVCNGPQLIEEEPEPCFTNAVTFPVGAIVAIVLAFVAVVAVAALFYVKNRKITAEYSRLKDIRAEQTDIEL